MPVVLCDVSDLSYEQIADVDRRADRHRPVAHPPRPPHVARLADRRRGGRAMSDQRRRRARATTCSRRYLDGELTDDERVRGRGAARGVGRAGAPSSTRSPSRARAVRGLPRSAMRRPASGTRSLATVEAADDAAERRCRRRRAGRRHRVAPQPARRRAGWIAGAAAVAAAVDRRGRGARAQRRCARTSPRSPRSTARPPPTWATRSARLVPMGPLAGRR